MRNLETALNNLLKHVAEAGMNQGTSAEDREATEREEPARKPLPFIDEEKLDGIFDPDEREKQRRSKEDYYNRYPENRQIAEKLSEKRKAELSRLPVFPQETRPAVNVLSNSSLFSAIQGKDRQLMNDAHLDTQDGVEIIFSGEQLNQDDHDVLMQLIFLASEKELGEPIKVSAHSLLKSLGRGTSGKEHKQLKAEIRRLVKATIQLKTKKFNYMGHLISESFEDEESKMIAFRANPTLRKFYDVNTYTLIDWNERKSMKGKDLARWLHLEISSHARPFPIKVETLRRLSGSQSKELYSFRQKLKTALDYLKERGILADWRIDNDDLVHVDRGNATSASQQRHLAKPAARRSLPKPQG